MKRIPTTLIKSYLGALIFTCAAVWPALAQVPVDLTGSFPVTETWSVTLYRGADAKPTKFSGTEKGTLTVSNGVYKLINASGADLGKLGVSRTIYYDNNYGDLDYGDYIINGSYPFSAEGGGGGELYGFIELTFFVVKIPLGSQADVPSPYPYDSSPFTSTGTSLSSLSCSGSMVDENAAYGPIGPSYYIDEADASSTAAITFPPVAPSITAQPFNQTVSVGANVSFSAGASGTPTPTYHWKHNGTTLANGARISGATTQILSITGVQTGDAGTYAFEASNSKGSATASATLTVETGQVLTNLYNFPGGSGGADPVAGVVVSGSTLYGTSLQGGASDEGTVFTLNSDGADFTNLHSFSATATNDNGVNTNSDGTNPYAGLAVSGDILYGATISGGHWGNGAVFSVHADGTGFTNLYSFSANSTNSYGFRTNSDGIGPEGGLILSANTLYGTASYGGAAGWGTVFALKTDGSGFTCLYDFTNGDDGAEPSAGLLLSGGTLYGTAGGGSLAGNGTVFALSTNGAGFAVLYAFSETDTNGFNNDGADPVAGLIVTNNTLYGTAAFGGHAANGTVFSLHTDGGGFTTLHSFSGSLGSETFNVDVTNGDGAYPYGTLALSDNTLYGVASTGGSAGNGTVFSVSTAGTAFGILYTFSPMDANGDNSDGSAPQAGLTLSDNALYGTTTSGGTDGLGTIFSLALEPASVSQGSEKGNPKLAITSPKSDASVSNGTFIVLGTTTDKVSVTNVSYQLNSNGWTSATPSNSFWSNWTAGVTLRPGTNTFSAYAQDASGAVSATATVKFTYILSASLTVGTNGLGSIAPVKNAKLLAIGENYTLTAAPAKNWLFSNWVASGSGNFVSNNPVLKFTMQSNLVLTANFVTNVFLAAQGGYYGLFMDTNATRAQGSSGGFDFNLTSTGSFTGTLLLGSNTVKLSPGAFDVGGAAEIVSKLKSGASLTTSLQLDFASQTVSGTVSNGTFVAQLNGFRNVFSVANKAAAYQGHYTLVIPGTNEAAFGPYGTSYGTVTVSSSGVVTFAGALADGTTGLSQSSAVSADGDWPLYVNLYGGAGSLWGWASISNRQIAASVSWMNATNSSKLGIYRGGFTNQEAPLMGYSYVSTNKPLFGLTNGQMTLEQGGSAPFVISNDVSISASGVIKVQDAPDVTNKLTLKITPSTGVISGTFANPLNTKQTVTFNGVLLQGQASAAGYFLGTNQSGAFMLDNP